MTCEHGSPVKVGEPFDESQCRVCWLRGAAKGSAKVMKPCRFKGEPAGPKGWHICENESEPLGLVVCGCKGCGPRCPGYAPPA